MATPRSPSLELLGITITPRWVFHRSTTWSPSQAGRGQEIKNTADFRWIQYLRACLLEPASCCISLRCLKPVSEFAWCYSSLRRFLKSPCQKIPGWTKISIVNTRTTGSLRTPARRPWSMPCETKWRIKIDRHLCNKVIAVVIFLYQFYVWGGAQGAEPDNGYPTGLAEVNQGLLGQVRMQFHLVAARNNRRVAQDVHQALRDASCKDIKNQKALP